VTFLLVETATFADAVQQAARVAPSKGAAFDKAAGILFEVVADGTALRIRSTDLESTFERTIPLVEGMFDAPVFRLPSQVLAGFLMQLELGDGFNTEITLDDSSRVAIQSGTTHAKFRTIDPESFPRVEVDPDFDSFVAVPEFAKRVKQVAWCVARDTAPLTGVYLNGKGMVACDRSRAAQVPCVIPLDHPITAPLTALSGVLSATDEVRLGGVGDRLVIVPEPETIITSTIYTERYPDVDRLWASTAACTERVEFDPKEMLSVLSRILVLCRGERYPVMTLSFAKHAMVLDMEVEDLGQVTDEVPCSTNFDEMFVMRFTPTNFVDALGAMNYGKLAFERNPAKPIKLWDDDGFETIMMPRRK
jgi:DNA polymerase III sliding clamp (beta) subunit (PCNA family)